jgi:uncharacterized protein YlaI
MPPVFTAITFLEMASFLQEKGFNYFSDRNAQEIVFEKVMKGSHGKNCFIRVYTSIDKRTKITRAVGNDAIRVIVLDDKATIFYGEGRVNRTQNWKDNLTKRLNNWSELIYYCPQCHNPLRKRAGKYGKFWGCSTYPLCGYTESIK